MSLTRRILSLIGRLLVVAMLALMTTSVVAVVSPSAANANCLSTSPFTGYIYFDDQHPITETPVAGDCNNDGRYSTVVSALPGWEASLWFYNPDVGYSGVAGTGLKKFNFGLVGGKSRKDFVICGQNVSRGVIVCGHGQATTATGSRVANVQTIAKQAWGLNLAQVNYGF